MKDEKKGESKRIFQTFDLRNQAVEGGFYRDGEEYKNSLNWGANQICTKG